jgi:hypothetical protein
VRVRPSSVRARSELALALSNDCVHRLQVLPGTQQASRDRSSGSIRAVRRPAHAARALGRRWIEARSRSVSCCRRCATATWPNLRHSIGRLRRARTPRWADPDHGARALYVRQGGDLQPSGHALLFILGRAAPSWPCFVGQDHEAVATAIAGQLALDSARASCACRPAACSRTPRRHWRSPSSTAALLQIGRHQAAQNLAASSGVEAHKTGASPLHGLRRHAGPRRVHVQSSSTRSRTSAQRARPSGHSVRPGTGSTCAARASSRLRSPTRSVSPRRPWPRARPDALARTPNWSRKLSSYFWGLPTDRRQPGAFGRKLLRARSITFGSRPESSHCQYRAGFQPGGHDRDVQARFDDPRARAASGS